MRTFVAIALDAERLRRVIAAVDALRDGIPGVKWLAPEQIHLTLKFIGELAEADVPAAGGALETAAAAAGPFRIRLGCVGTFPPSGKRPPCVIHVTAEEPTGALAALAGDIEGALHEAAGVEPERRPFRGHVTLGRVKRPEQCASASDVAALAAGLAGDGFGAFDVTEFILFFSRLTPHGPIHTPMKRFRLKGDAR